MANYVDVHVMYGAGTGVDLYVIYVRNTAWQFIVYSAASYPDVRSTHYFSSKAENLYRHDDDMFS